MFARLLQLLGTNAETQLTEYGPHDHFTAVE
jgi:hypothetical protein